MIQLVYLMFAVRLKTSFKVIWKKIIALSMILYHFRINSSFNEVVSLAFQFPFIFIFYYLFIYFFLLSFWVLVLEMYFSFFFYELLFLSLMNMCLFACEFVRVHHELSFPPLNFEIRSRRLKFLFWDNQSLNLMNKPRSRRSWRFWTMKFKFSFF